MPVIVVQLVHIQGPLKGQIQEFMDNEITIGRNPSCQVQFPPDVTSISRMHAELIREGNRFKVVDHSTNGTFVNGKRITEAYLKDGDVIMFTEGGPKASFLAKITDAVQTEQPSYASDPGHKPAQRAPAPTPEPAQPQAARPAPKPAPPQRQVEMPPEPVRQPHQVVQKVQAPLIIQFGPTLRTYKELPVVIGRKGNCDFVMNHIAIADQHAQIFFSQNQYWVRDLTGKNTITVNNRAINFEAPLNAQDVIILAPDGPAFRFLGEGRLAEHEEVVEQDLLKPKPAHAPVKEEKKEKSILKDFFKK